MSIVVKVERKGTETSCRNPNQGQALKNNDLHLMNVAIVKTWAQTIKENVLSFFFFCHIWTEQRFLHLHIHIVHHGSEHSRSVICYRKVYV